MCAFSSAFGVCVCVCVCVCKYARAFVYVELVCTCLKLVCVCVKEFNTWPAVVTRLRHQQLFVLIGCLLLFGRECKEMYGPSV